MQGQSDGRITALIEKWSGATGGAERANFQSFIRDLVSAFDLPEPEMAVGGVLGAYQFEGPVAGGSAASVGGTGYIDLYRRGCFVMEAKQTKMKAGDTQVGLFDADAVIPLSPAGAQYDRVMIGAQRQAKNYAVNLPADHPSVPFLIVCDVGRAFELYFDHAGNGRGYGFFPDKQSYRIPFVRLRDPDVQALFRDIWLNPAARDPRLKAAEVTRDVSKRLAEVSKALEASNRFRARELAAVGKESEEIEETALFLMRIIFCMFAEDIELLPKDAFKNFLEEAIANDDHFERGLAELWSAMGKPHLNNRYSMAVRSTVRYFNGGLFENNRTFRLTHADKGELFEAAKRQWRDVEPAIFGTLLEGALTVGERAKFGAHYTPRVYVERIVQATIMDVLNAEWSAVQEQLTDPAMDSEAARHIAHNFHDRIARVTVLDPACGTGNFLYVAMDALESLEAQVIEVRQQLGDRPEPRVSPAQFFGLEKNPRAAKIAELVLWIGWLRFRIRNAPESIVDPVLARGANINFGRHGGYDAVLLNGGAGEALLADWPEVEFIVGNPPFIGGKDLRAKLGHDYAEAMWAANARVPKSADFVMQWWDRAAHILTAPGTKLRRFGFVTTNSITQTFSRRVIEGYLSSSLSSPLAGEGARRAGEGDEGKPLSLTPLTPLALGRESPSPAGGEGEGMAGLSLIYAIPDHPWTKSTKDAAAVRIAMTVAEAGRHAGTLAEVTREAALDSDAPLIELARSEGAIHADLTLGADVTATRPLRANESLASPGVKLHGAGFIVTPAQAAYLGLGKREGLDAHIRPYRHGRDLLQHSRGVMVIDLFGLEERDVRQRFPEVYQHLLTTVKPERDVNRRDSYKRLWWVHGEPRKDMRPALAGLPRYIATVETSKHRLFQFLDAAILPDNMLVAIGSDDAFHLGVLSSGIHVGWSILAGGWLGMGNDSRYSKSRVFDPFPFPDATPDQRAAIADLAEELDATRKAALDEVSRLTMTELYNLRAGLRAGTLDAAGQDRAMAARAGIVDRLHDQIDAAVADAYGWPADLPPSEIVARLVALNAERAAEEAAGHIRWLRPDYQIARFAAADAAAPSPRRAARESILPRAGGGGEERGGG